MVTDSTQSRQQSEPEHWEVRQLTIDLMSAFDYKVFIDEKGSAQVDFRYDQLAEALIKMGYHKTLNP